MTLSSGLDPSVIQPGVPSVPSASGFHRMYSFLKVDFDFWHLSAGNEYIHELFSLSNLSIRYFEAGCEP